MSDCDVITKYFLKICSLTRTKWNTDFSVFLQVDFQGLHIVVKAQRWHGKQYVFSIDGLPLLLVTPFAGSVATLSGNMPGFMRFRDYRLHAVKCAGQRAIQHWAAQHGHFQGQRILACDEADELRDALLYTLFSIFGNLIHKIIGWTLTSFISPFKTMSCGFAFNSTFFWQLW